MVPDAGANVEVLIEGLKGPKTLAVAHGFLYFYTYSASATALGGVQRLAVDGTSPPENIAAVAPHALRAHNEEIFSAQNQMYRYSPTGGLVQIGTARGPTTTDARAGLAVNSMGAIWSDAVFGRIMAIPYGDSANAVPVASVPEPGALAADDSDVFVTTGTSASRVLQAHFFGTSTATLSEFLDVAPWSVRAIALSSRFVFLILRICEHTNICRFALQRIDRHSRVVDVPQPSSPLRILGVAADEQDVYWLTRTSLMRTPHGGLEAVSVVPDQLLLWQRIVGTEPSGFLDPVGTEWNGIVVTADFVYLIDPQVHGDTIEATGRILRIRKGPS